MTELVSLALDQIDVGERLRIVDNDYVDLLAASMAENGLTNPITVGKKSRNGNHPLIAGLHRLEAAKKLGWPEMFAIAEHVTDGIQKKLIEIDENLIRRELSQLDRAIFLAQRQEIYETLYPETKAGVAGANATNGITNAKFAFAEDAARKIGISKRSIQLSIHRFKKICPKVRARIATTWIADKGTELDALVKLEPTDQMACIEEMLSEDGPAKSVKQALSKIQGDEAVPLSPEEKQLAALKLNIAKASDAVVVQFIEFLKELELV